MASVQENIKRLNELETIVENHPVGGKVEIQSRHIVIIFFDNWAGFNGVRVSLDKGKINALTLLIQKLDSLYNQENEWSSNHTELKSI